MPTFHVSNQSELNAALANSTGDTVIALAAGDYGSMFINGKGAGGSLTLTSADGAHPASFKSLDIDRSSNIHLDGLAFTPSAGRGLFVHNSSNVSIQNDSFVGGPSGVSNAEGLYIENSHGVLVQGSSFSNLHRGSSITYSDHVKVLDNTFKDVGSDGMDYAQVTDVEIARNFGTRFHPTDNDHPDFIQFWTYGTTASSQDIRIHDNVFLQGEGRWIEGIFMGNETSNIHYKNVTIENNLIYTSHWNALVVVGGENVAVHHNTILGLPDVGIAYDQARIRIDASSSVDVSGNVANQFRANNALDIPGNVTATLHGGNGALSYDAVFAHADASTRATVADFTLDAGRTAGADTRFLPTGAGGHVTVVPTVVPTVGGGGGGGGGGGSGGGTGTVGGGGSGGGGGGGTDPATDGRVLPGTESDDEIRGGVGRDTIAGGAGRDLIYGNKGDDVIYGNLDADVVYGGQGADLVFGGQGDDVVYGNLDSDVIYGNMGSDTLFGGQGDDVLYGGSGDDVLFGGSGNDTLYGNKGADRFVIGANAGVDTIQGFSLSQGDRLDLGGQSYILYDTPEGLRLDLSGGGAVILAGTGGSDFSDSYIV